MTDIQTLKLIIVGSIIALIWAVNMFAIHQLEERPVKIKGLRNRRGK